ncbi:LrgB family protein [Bacillus sp. FSL K6-3431]|uniref:LrgB family protein n=1 Tax=Bacillus sp. FSL K6-3431 TaxID=2921500 RepID=UPI0030F5C591
MNDILIGLLSIFVTIIVFFASKWLNNKYPHPLTIPILISTIIIVIGLLVFNIAYETYFIGGQWIDHLLGPAVVALAFPLYQQRFTLKKNAIPIIIGVSFGSIIGVASGFIMGKWLALDPLIISSLLPKSVTSPVAMDIAHTVGGSPALAAVLVMIAGIGGAVMGPSLLKWVHVNHYLAKGVGMGSASHAIGTAKAMESDVKAGAVSTVAMVLSAIIVSIITPLLVIFFM